MRTDPPREPRSVLLVEDDPGDVALVRRALAAAEGDATLVVRRNADEALAIFDDLENGDSSLPMPDLVLLDLNLSGSHGSEVLAHLKRPDSVARNVPIVVVTTSSREEDVRESYRLGCNSYWVKPLEAKTFITDLQRLWSYWFDVVSLPGAKSRGSDVQAGGGLG